MMALIGPQLTRGTSCSFVLVSLWGVWGGGGGGVGFEGNSCWRWHSQEHPCDPPPHYYTHSHHFHINRPVSFKPISQPSTTINRILTTSVRWAILKKVVNVSCEDYKNQNCWNMLVEDQLSGLSGIYDTFKWITDACHLWSQAVG